MFIVILFACILKIVIFSTIRLEDSYLYRNNNVVTTLWLGCDKVVYNEQGDEHALTTFWHLRSQPCFYKVVTKLYNVVTM